MISSASARLVGLHCHWTALAPDNSSPIRRIKLYSLLVAASGLSMLTRKLNLNWFQSRQVQCITYGCLVTCPGDDARHQTRRAALEVKARPIQRRIKRSSTARRRSVCSLYQDIRLMVLAFPGPQGLDLVSSQILGCCLYSRSRP